MNNFLNLLVLCCVSFSFSAELSVFVMPTSDHSPEQDMAQRIDAYINQSFSLEDSQWKLQALPPQAKKCDQQDCYLKIISKYSSNDNTLLLLPSHNKTGTFSALSFSLVEVHTWRIIQSRVVKWRTYDPLEFGQINDILNQISNLHLSSKSNEEEFYHSQEKNPPHSFSKILKLWPLALLLPIAFLYL